MRTPARLAPLLAQYDSATERLLARLTGPEMDSGDGERVRVVPLTDTEMLTLRAEWTVGERRRTEADLQFAGGAAGAVRALQDGVLAWREALTSADDVALDTVGRSTYPDGSDAEDVFLDLVWWVNQEVLHHGAEIALLRDLHARR